MSAPTPIACGLRGLCPRCGAATLFDGPARLAARCQACPLDFSSFNVGNGPAALLTLFLGGSIMVAAIGLDLTIRPPLWIHILLWVPLTVVAVIVALRVSKGVLIALEYRTAAREGRIVES